MKIKPVTVTLANILCHVWGKNYRLSRCPANDLIHL
jgi:hypothetical protein